MNRGLPTSALRGLAVGGIVVTALVWGFERSSMPRSPSFPRPWITGNQLTPFAVSPDRDVQPIPDGPGRLKALNAFSVMWGEPDHRSPFVVYIRVSVQHWTRIHASAAELEAWTGSRTAARLEPGAWQPFSYALLDFMDDEDGDGDPLDPRELRPPGEGLEVWVLKRETATHPAPDDGEPSRRGK